jgi:hypothetical protein
VVPSILAAAVTDSPGASSTVQPSIVGDVVEVGWVVVVVVTAMVVVVVEAVVCGAAVVDDVAPMAEHDPTSMDTTTMAVRRMGHLLALESRPDVAAGSQARNSCVTPGELARDPLSATVGSTKRRFDRQLAGAQEMQLKRRFANRPGF